MAESLAPPAVPQASPQELVASFCQLLQCDAIERDRAGGVPFAARQWIRRHGLLALSAPTHTGGLGWSWSQLSPLVRQIARVDSSFAHLLSYHYLGLTIPQLFAAPAVAEAYFAAPCVSSCSGAMRSIPAIAAPGCALMETAFA